MHANAQCEWVWKMYVKFIWVVFIVNLSMALLSILMYSIFGNGQFEVKCLYHPFRFMWVKRQSTIFYFHPFDNKFSSIYTKKKFSLPWNQTSLLGYFGELFLSFIIGGAYLSSNALFLLTFISMCLHHQAFLQIFRDLTLDLDHCNENRTDKKLLFKLIDFHYTVKR